MDKPEDWVGKEEEHRALLTQELVNKYRATIERSLIGGGGSVPKEVVPLGLHWCLCQPIVPTSDLASDGHLEKGKFLPPVPLPRRMFAGSTVQFNAPLTIGAEITRKSRIASVAKKTGSTGELYFVKIEHRFLADGAVSLEERQTLVYRESPKDQLPMPQSEGADVSPWPIAKEITPSSAMLFRYSALTFNSHRIHYDLDYVTGEEGYPGLVVHGPLIASWLLQLASEQLGTDHIASFSFQAKSPAFCDQRLFLVAKLDDGGLSMAAIGADGRLVMEAEAKL